jgi:Asp-tRNA(Asn)/Glu-tRNA(Gln) amidotransferase A subunit family amidase
MLEKRPPATPLADCAELGAVELLAALAAGTLTAEAYVEALLARCEHWRHLNAFTALDPARSRAAARDSDRRRAAGTAAGPLEGLPVLIKDNIDLAGWVTTAGTAALRDYRPDHTASVAARLLAAGAFVLGKNTMHELAHGITSNNAYSGAVRNPYDPRMIPGGSSGGTAAALAARLGPIGLGTDTGGSVRIPAALCGIVGFRPSTGRYPTDGIVPISHTRDTPGVMARSVADIELIDRVVVPVAAPAAAATLAGCRFGVPRSLFYESLDPELAHLTERALERLRAAGAVLIEADVTGLEALNAPVAGVISDYEFPRDLAAYLASSGSGVSLEAVIDALASPDLRQTFAREVRGPAAPSTEAYRHALEVGRPAIQAACRAYFAEHALEAMIFPTTPLPASPIGADAEVELGGRKVSTFRTYLRNARPATTAGMPGLSLPVGCTAAGLPVGIEFDGPANSDRRLLALGAAAARVFGTVPPPAR